MLTIKKYQGDIEELNTLSTQATRTTVKQFLTSQKEKLETDLARLQKSEQDRISKLSANTTTTTSAATRSYTKKM